MRLPLSSKAENIEQKVQKMIEEMPMDTEIHVRLREKMLANGGLESKTILTNTNIFLFIAILFQ